MYWNKLCVLLGNVWHMLYTTCPQSPLWVSVSVVMRCLTCRGRWLDVDRGWFNHRKHSCLQGLEDNSLGLYGSLGVSQGHSCNHGFGLDGDLGPNLNGPLGCQRLFVWCLNHGEDGCGGGGGQGNKKINKFKINIYEYEAAVKHRWLLDKHLGRPCCSLEAFWPWLNSQKSCWSPNTLKQERAATAVRRPHPRW